MDKCQSQITKMLEVLTQAVVQELSAKYNFDEQEALALVCQSKPEKRGRPVKPGRKTVSKEEMVNTCIEMALSQEEEGGESSSSSEGNEDVKKTEVQVPVDAAAAAPVNTEKKAKADAKAEKELEKQAKADAKAQKELEKKEPKTKKAADAKEPKTKKAADAKEPKTKKAADAKEPKTKKAADAKESKTKKAADAKERTPTPEKTTKPTHVGGFAFKEQDAVVTVSSPKEKKASASKRADDEEDDEEDEIECDELTYEGKEYLRTQDGIILDKETHDPVGTWDSEENDIVFSKNE